MKGEGKGAGISVLWTWLLDVCSVGGKEPLQPHYTVHSSFQYCNRNSVHKMHSLHVHCISFSNIHTLHSSFQYYNSNSVHEVHSVHGHYTTFSNIHVSPNCKLFNLSAYMCTVQHSPTYTAHSSFQYATATVYTRCTAYMSTVQYSPVYIVHLTVNCSIYQQQQCTQGVKFTFALYNIQQHTQSI